MLQLNRNLTYHTNIIKWFEHHRSSPLLIWCFRPRPRLRPHHIKNQHSLRVEMMGCFIPLLQSSKVAVAGYLHGELKLSPCCSHFSSYKSSSCGAMIAWKAFLTLFMVLWWRSRLSTASFSRLRLDDFRERWVETEPRASPPSLLCASPEKEDWFLESMKAI